MQVCFQPKVVIVIIVIDIQCILSDEIGFTVPVSDHTPTRAATWPFNVGAN